MRTLLKAPRKDGLVALVFDESNNPSRKQSFAALLDMLTAPAQPKRVAPSRSAIPSVSRAARRENANIRFIFSVLLRTFFAIPGPFFFWKEVKTNAFNPNREHLSKGSYDHFRCFFGHG